MVSDLVKFKFEWGRDEIIYNVCSVQSCNRNAKVVETMEQRGISSWEGWEAFQRWLPGEPGMITELSVGPCTVDLRGFLGWGKECTPWVQHGVGGWLAWSPWCVFCKRCPVKGPGGESSNQHSPACRSWHGKLSSQKKNNFFFAQMCHLPAKPTPRGCSF